MTTPKTIHYIFNELQEAVQSYHMCLDRLEKWESMYPQYRFDIDLMTSGIKRSPTVRIAIYKNNKK
jgi:hypothetical protein